MESLEVKLFQMEFYEEVVKLWIAAGLKLTFSDTRDEIAKFYEHNKNSFFILVKDGKIIGTVIGAFDGRRGYVHHLAILPDFQHHNYGTLLMEHLTEYYRKNGVVKIHLFIEKPNEAVGKFYEKLDWHYRDDIILMSKTLRSIDTIMEDNQVKVVNKDANT